MDVEQIFQRLLNNSNGRALLLRIVERSIKTAQNPPRDLNDNVLFTELESLVFEMINRR
jgi:hypothetical protein